MQITDLVGFAISEGETHTMGGAQEEAQWNVQGYVN